MAIIAFIPARCGSKSIKFKNIKDFYGKPLIYWNLIALQQSDEISKIVVATDCNEISNVVKGFNFSKVDVYMRDSENAKDISSTESVMLEYIENAKLKKDDTFMLVQATSPFTKTNHFNEAIKKYKSEDVDSLLTCVRIKRFFWEKSGKSVNYDYKKRPRRQDFEGQLVENGAFYINSVENIKKSKNRLSGNIGIYKMPEYTFFELDEDDDWVIAENLMKKYSSKLIEKSEIKLFLTDIDGVLTDAGMYYTENGDELKKFNTRDGMGINLLKNSGIKTGIITSEDKTLNKRRAEKLKMDYIFQGAKNKLELANRLCNELNITLKNVAYIGDDINDFELLSNVGLAACPNDANIKIKNINNINILQKNGGEGVVREFIETLICEN